jgi:hypothetical protein
MLKKSAAGVLARHGRLTISVALTSLPRLIQRGVNLRGSTYHRARAAQEQLEVGRMKKDTPRLLRHRALINSRPSANVTHSMLRVADLAAALPAEQRVSARLARLAGAAKRARRGWAGENNSLFEHPEIILALAPYGKVQPWYWLQPSFMQPANRSGAMKGRG